MVEKFPGWRYNPATLEGEIFNNADEVPDGWVESLGEAPAPAAPKSDKADKGMSRQDIMTALKNGNVEFKATMKTEELHDLLKGKVMEVLAQRNIAFDADADVRDLLAKLS